ncbi:gliding motility-associated peptidyl-prolyl isomerase GldI [Psychroflexus sp. MBR-150]|jgi:gliding motility-associated peptidyl-prolyl isomerase
MQQFRIVFSFFLMAFLVSCHQPQPRKPVSYQNGSFLDKSLKRNKAILKAEEKAIFKIIENDSSNTYYNSSDGFWYHYVQKNNSDTITPQFGDQVTFTYNLRTFSEDTIYTMAEIGQRKYLMDQQRLMTGLREGLKIMKAGEQVTFLFPSSRAYGFYGDKKRIGSDVPLKATVILKSIKQTER